MSNHNRYSNLKFTRLNRLKCSCGYGPLIFHSNSSYDGDDDLDAICGRCNRKYRAYPQTYTVYPIDNYGNRN